MIGVALKSQDMIVVREFFELFKTPWENAMPDRKYRVALVANASIGDVDAEVLVVYDSRELEIDRAAGIVGETTAGPAHVEWGQQTIHAYNGVRSFQVRARKDLEEGDLKLKGKAVDYRYLHGDRVIWRIGYDLFEEIHYLLTKGQPAEYALTPTLELHIELLRQLLIKSRIPFIEIPPRPAGFDYLCCLTHDIDFFGIRRHMFDRTMAGFLYRSSIGSIVDLFRGRRSIAEVATNWRALCKLPFVLAGILPDFWTPFEDYAKVEDTRQSTFYLIPFKGIPGIAPDGTVNNWRAASYGISDVQDDVRMAVRNGSEVGLHGIDAWLDCEAGRKESEEVLALTGGKTIGVRMHWLYFGDGSHRTLEEAGFFYDSTCGYNEAVGYRAGTAQVFCPLGNRDLSELPMSIMDSALFSSGRMGLSADEALRLCHQLMNRARDLGGVLVINWHDRSLAPERLSGRFYRQLVKDIEGSGRVWFSRAYEAVQWFRWRRSIRFERVNTQRESCMRVTAPYSMNPGVDILGYSATPWTIDVGDQRFDGEVPRLVTFSSRA